MCKAIKLSRPFDIPSNFPLQMRLFRLFSNFTCVCTLYKYNTYVCHRAVSHFKSISYFCSGNDESNGNQGIMWPNSGEHKFIVKASDILFWIINHTTSFDCVPYVVVVLVIVLVFFKPIWFYTVHSLYNRSIYWIFFFILKFVHLLLWARIMTHWNVAESLFSKLPCQRKNCSIYI